MPSKRIRYLLRSLKRSFQKCLGQSHLLKLSEIEELDKRIALTEQELFRSVKYRDRGLIAILCVLYRRKGEAELMGRLIRKEIADEEMQHLWRG